MGDCLEIGLDEVKAELIYVVSQYVAGGDGELPPAH